MKTFHFILDLLLGFGVLGGTVLYFAWNRAIIDGIPGTSEISFFNAWLLYVAFRHILYQPKLFSERAQKQ
jgi:hypothetical protein